MEKIQNPNYQINQRLKAALFDSATFAVLYFLVNLLLSFLVTSISNKYTSAYETLTTHIEYSNLAKVDPKNGFLLYERDELVEAKDDNFIFCNVTSYFYLNYLSNTDLKEGYEGSKDVVTHDIKWFNENVLEIGSKDIFKAKSSDPNSLSTEIGVFNESYLLSNGQDSVKDFVLEKYNSAVQDFYDLGFITEANKVMSRFNQVITFASAVTPLLVFYVLVPALTKYKQTFGKKIFKVVTVRNDEIASVPVLLLRIVPAALVCALISIINESGFNLGLIVVALLVSSGLMIFSKKNLSVHDYVAGTKVITLESYKELKDANKQGD